MRGATCCFAGYVEDLELGQQRAQLADIKVRAHGCPVEKHGFHVDICHPVTHSKRR